MARWGRVRTTGAAAARTVRALRVLVGTRRALRAGAATEDLLRAYVRSAPPAAAAGGPSPAAAAAAVRRASALLPGTSCIPRAVAMATLLSPSRADLAVVLGAKRDATARWVAHAWVEVDGAPWLDDGAAAFQRLASYDARSDWSLAPPASPR